ncbi:MAG TPA: DUF2914 domain-containing protein [Burkholderiales bacterium]|jgi:hypothetical protein|nr:DUF2914 domain-containing protein [Burkholderiales bacterium]
MSAPAPAATPGRLDRLRRYYDRNERKIAVGSFVGGFVFDILTLDRIDSWITIAQQAAYLVVITAALLQMFFEEGVPQRDFTAMPAWKRACFQYRSAIVHFLLGSLLSLYTLFFFKSSSLFVSFGFLAVLAVLLVINESERFKKLGLAFKFALLSLCGLSFTAALVPIAAGSIGLVVFLLSMLVGCIPMALLYRRILIHAPGRVVQARRQMMIPFGIVLCTFLALYVVRVIPPVPLSIPFIGVYHGVERQGDRFVLSHERPFWRFWDNGDQQFAAQPGDRVFVFFRIFSPTRFADQVLMRWYREDAAGRWQLQDSIPINIVGGRAQGFRGYGMKSNYQPGRWKLQVETTDEREIGRVYFEVEAAPQAPREFKQEVQ